MRTCNLIIKLKVHKSKLIHSQQTFKSQVIPTYSISCSNGQKTICDGINSLLAKYWRGQNKDEKKNSLDGLKKALHPKEGWWDGILRFMLSILLIG